MLLPTLPDLYIYNNKLSTVVKFVNIVIISFNSEKDEEEFFIPM